MSGHPHPKPVTRPRARIRHTDAQATRRAVLAHPSCPICGGPAATGHHVLARGAPHFGDDVPENLVALCGSGTTGCHGDVEHAVPSARLALGLHIVHERPDVTAYVVRKIGEGYAREWFLRHLRVEVLQDAASV